MNVFDPVTVYVCIVFPLFVVTVPPVADNIPVAYEIITIPSPPFPEAKTTFDELIPPAPPPPPTPFVPSAPTVF